MATSIENANSVNTGKDPEITPEMAEAGALALAKYDSRFEELDEAAARIYRAMTVAQSK